MLKIAANISMLFTEHPLLARFAAAKSAGFEAVEIQFPYDHTIADLQEASVAANIPIILINVPAADYLDGGDGLACVPGKEKLFDAALTQALDYAKALDIPMLNVLSGRQPHGETTEDCFSTLYSNLEHAVSRCRKKQITVVCEAINVFDMPRTLIHSLRHMQAACEKIDGLKMQFDAYHMARMGEDIIKAAKHNLENIAHIQFADCPGRSEPGTGQLDYSGFFNMIKQSNYDGWCSAEYRPLKHSISAREYGNPSPLFKVQEHQQLSE